LRLVFAGTPEFARIALQRLSDAGHDIALVLTQPDRPAGRGLKLQESPVKVFARERASAVVQPRSLRLDGRYAEDAAQAVRAITDAHADVMVVAAYGLILPRWVLDAMRMPGAGGKPGHGCINIHASLLPRWRGAAPIHRAIEAGDAVTGVTIMQMDEGLDTGDMLLVDQCPITHTGPQADTTASLHDKLAALGADMVVRVLALVEKGQLVARPQPADGVTYAQKVEKAQACMPWAADARLVARRVRAFNPAPGAWTVLGQEVLKVWQAESLPQDAPANAPPGSVLAVAPCGIDVACGRGCLRITELQKAGGKRLAAADFLRGFDLRPGMRFTSGPDA
jgi:methionyl-tRNA formyltransferase